MLNLKIYDVSGTRSFSAELPGDVEVNRILILLVERMNLPINSPDGQLMSYKLNNKKSGKQLFDDQTLLEAGIVNNDELRLQPEITAGK